MQLAQEGEHQGERQSSCTAEEQEPCTAGGQEGQKRQGPRTAVGARVPGSSGEPRVAQKTDTGWGRSFGL